MPEVYKAVQKYAAEMIEAAVLEEREACAGVAVRYTSDGVQAYHEKVAAIDIAAAIRARGGAKSAE
jgi:hypothetical protein